MDTLPQIGRVFRLNNRDLTFFKLEKDEKFINGVRITFYMRFEKVWMYPPDTAESRFWSNFKKYGYHNAEIEFEKEVQRLENWYKEQVGQ